MKKSLLLLLLALCTLSVDAVVFFSRQLNTTNGLPSNNIRSLAQDAKGFIWMGSPNGLYRYDGYFFTTFRYAESGNLRLLNNNHISICYALPDGRMLFREQGNLFSVYDTDQEQFVELPSTQMETLYQQMRRREAPKELLDPYQNILTHGGNYINDNLGNVIVLDQTGQIWFIDRKTHETIRMKVFDEHLFSVVSSPKYKVLTSVKKGLIWVSTNGCGITVYNRNTHETTHITRQSGLISTDNIQDICLDRNDNLWVADEFHGVVCISTEQSQGEVRLLDTTDDAIRGNQVRLMHILTDSLFWVVNVRGDVYEADARLRLLRRNSEQPMDIHSLCIDKEGRLWIGSRKQGLRHPDGSWMSHGSGNANTLSGNNVNVLLCDRDGHIWAGCEEGRLDLVADSSVRHFLPAKTSPKVIVQSRQGTIWVGARTGLYSFLPDRLLKDTSQYRHVLTSCDISYSDVSCICEDSHGRLWVGTIGDGLYRSDNGGKAFTHITVRDGLISNDIQSLIDSDDGVMWVGTTNGITLYNSDDGQCQYIYNEHNMQQNYYAEDCVSRLQGGLLAFGTNQGILIFNPSQTHNLTTAPPHKLCITDLLINGESVGPATGHVILTHNQNSLNIRFSTFNFNNSTRFTYWLEGYDRQWSELSANSFAEYKNLSPGHYLLHVKAYDSNQASNSEQALTIIIRHPWWQTWWAYLIYSVVAIALIYAVYRQLRTVYDLRRRISIEQELTEYKLVFFTNISHEFRTPLTIIRAAMDHIRNIRELPADLRQPVSNMRRSTDRLLRLINQLLEFRKMQAGKLQLGLEDTDAIAFVREICQSFNDLAEGKQIGYHFSTNVKSCEIPLDRQNVDKVVYNLLSNAFKYTPSRGSVEVRLRIEDGLLTIIVEDTGVGIPKEKQAELFQRFMQSTFSADSIGIGLHLTKALVEVHHGTIRFEENQPQGSRFIVQLPAARDAYQPEDFLQQSQLEAVKQKHEPVYQEVTGQPMNDRQVLVVEDDADVADLLKQTLGRYFHVRVAMDGAAALEWLKDNKPDLIVSDVMMPVMNGYELTRRLRSQASLQTIPIILLTALTADDKRLKGTQAGADAYLTKPFDTQLLISTCRQLIEQRDLVRRQAAESQDTQPATAPPEIIVEERDRKLLDAMNAWLYNHISDPMLSVDNMAEAMGYRRSVFFKKVKALTGQTPADYIKTLRMNRAAEFLREETITVAEVCYKVGISDPHYFAKVFKQVFGISPKKYQQGTHIPPYS
ncbi:MAG: response regulator [Prevotella sp.]|nr:response regulator [Prevotella sp.]